MLQFVLGDHQCKIYVPQFQFQTPYSTVNSSTNTNQYQNTNSLNANIYQDMNLSALLIYEQQSNISRLWSARVSATGFNISSADVLCSVFSLVICQPQSKCRPTVARQQPRLTPDLVSREPIFWGRPLSQTAILPAQIVGAAKCVGLMDSSDWGPFYSEKKLFNSIQFYWFI